MNFFSGFCFRNESELFEPWLVEGETVLAGFSYGAIRAFEQAWRSQERVDRLLLFSPAFFQNRPQRFVSLQLDAFERDEASYRRTFLRRCAEPARMDLSAYEGEGTGSQLEELLRYRWEPERIRSLLKRGVTIEVFLGRKDRIIDSAAALELFQASGALCYEFRHAGHLLRPVTIQEAVQNR